MMPAPAAIVKVENVEDPLSRDRDADACRSHDSHAADRALDPDGHTASRRPEMKNDVARRRVDVDAVEDEGAEIQVRARRGEIEAEAEWPDAPELRVPSGPLAGERNDDVEVPEPAPVPQERVAALAGP